MDPFTGTPIDPVEGTPAKMCQTREAAAAVGLRSQTSPNCGGLLGLRV